MSHFTIALIIVLAVIIILSTLVIMHNTQIKQRKNSILFFFRNAGAAHNLSFTGQEILQDKVIGLDGPKRKLLIAEERSEEYEAQVIDLDDVRICKIKKVYAAINSHEYRKNRPEDYLRTIALEFEFKAGGPSRLVPFFKSELNSVYEIPELETRARNWATILSDLTILS